MSRYAAFLRGMNVGGHRITNADLSACFAALGFTDVACFRASGNVVFAGERQSPAAVTARIEQGLQETLGYAVPTFVRTAEQVTAIAAASPFAAEHVAASTGKLHVALLSAAPAAAAQRDVLSLHTERDRLAFGERALFWLPSGRMTESGLDLAAVERLLGPMTLRTKNTIEQIAAKHLALG
jgi:uncharacterized protein (DUF1697 family)